MPKDEMSPINLLAIDDDPENLELISECLGDLAKVVTATSPKAGLELFAQLRPRIVLLDLIMPEMNGMEVLEKIVGMDPGTDVILVTSHYSTDSAVEAIQKGACDYLTKPLEIAKLRERITTLVDEAKLRSKSAELDKELLRAFQFEGMVGRSPQMLDVFSRIRRVASHFRVVLVTGATGTGKELVARALHHLSPNSAAPFGVCNCSAIVETLFESELFGYVKGAFTGATQDKVGLFEYSNGGTVFLDEIGELPLAAQAKLLRVLQNQEIQRVGSPVPRKVNARVVAATHRDLKSLVTEGKFREDLYYRLSMVEIKVPRLNDRKEDLPLLIRQFVQAFSKQYGKEVAGLTRRTQTIMGRYSWPGNVRELENVIGNACMMAHGNVIDVNDLPENLRNIKEDEPTGASYEPQGMMSLDELEQRHVAYVLEKVGGDKSRAAEILGVSRSTLYSILAKTRSLQKAVGDT